MRLQALTSREETVHAGKMYGATNKIISTIAVSSTSGSDLDPLHVAIMWTTKRDSTTLPFGDSTTLPFEDTVGRRITWEGPCALHLGLARDLSLPTTYLPPLRRWCRSDASREALQKRKLNPHETAKVCSLGPIMRAQWLGRSSTQV